MAVYLEEQVYCEQCKAFCLGRARAVNHVLHLMVSFLLCGWWLFAWGIIAVFWSPRWLCSHCGTSCRGPGSSLTKLIGVVCLAVPIVAIVVIGGSVAAGLMPARFAKRGDSGSGGSPTPDFKDRDDGPKPHGDPPPLPIVDSNVENVIVTVLNRQDAVVSEDKYYRVELDGTTGVYTLDELFKELRKRHRPPEKIVRIATVYLAHGGDDTIATIQLIKRARLENITVATSRDK